MRDAFVLDTLVSIDGMVFVRVAFEFETGAQQYLWLNTNLYIAKGRLLGAGHIEYEVYRVL